MSKKKKKTSRFVVEKNLGARKGWLLLLDGDLVAWCRIKTPILKMQKSLEDVELTAEVVEKCRLGLLVL